MSALSKREISGTNERCNAGRPRSLFFPAVQAGVWGGWASLAIDLGVSGLVVREIMRCSCSVLCQSARIAEMEDYCKVWTSKLLAFGPEGHAPQR